VILPKSGRIGRVRQQVSVIADILRADAEELLSFRQFVGVQDHFFRGVEDFLLAAKNLVLFALLVTVVVPIRAAAHGHAEVGLFDMAENFGVEFLLNCFEGLGHRRCVCVFCFQIRRDVRRALLAEPEVRVAQRVALNGARERLLFSDRRRSGREIESLRVGLNEGAHARNHEQRGKNESSHDAPFEFD
jgi:hypothetical protein